jgi:SAM-dependent methyltransferase
MNLSQIVQFKNQIDGLKVDPVGFDAVRHFEDILHHVSNNIELRMEADIKNVERDLNQIQQSVGSFRESFAGVSKSLQQLVESQDQHIYDHSMKVYREEFSQDTVAHILDRRLLIDTESETIMRARLKSYADWRLPGMIIRPRTEDYINDMVALDPLYLVDHDMELLRPSTEQYLPEYQRRLRRYIINDYVERPIFRNFPAGQFGVIFAYNYFNYKPLSVIDDYLAEMFQLLRPGGILIFTYNNCDLWHCVSFAEKNYMCYTPGIKIWNLAQKNGYVVNFEHNGVLDAKWIELKKPGEITSIKGGQSLAKIVVGL